MNLNEYIEINYCGAGRKDYQEFSLENLIYKSSNRFNLKIKQQNLHIYMYNVLH